MGGPELEDNHVLDCGLYTVILKAFPLYGSAPYWAAVVTHDDHMTIRRMNYLPLNDGKFLFIKRISKVGEDIFWADAIMKFKSDVECDYRRVLATTEEGTAPRPRAQVVMRRAITCIEWIVFLIDQDQLEPEVLL